MTAKKVYIESYGCQMNFSDSEIVLSVLSEDGYTQSSTPELADLIFLNTCSIRDKAEQTIRKRLQSLNHLKTKKKGLKIGVLGCMAERLKDKLILEEKMVDMVVGPDAYRELPELIRALDRSSQATSINTQLSLEETYGDITPVRRDDQITAFTTIMRGCDNMCSFCVVPFTRGRERSRAPESIVKEVQTLWEMGYKEVTLLGQNVDSYLWFGGGPKKRFKALSELEKISAMSFADLLELVSLSVPEMRIRFSTSNPQDMTTDVLHTIAKHPNICNYIHLPVQSGSNRILNLMNRGYTRERYLDLIGEIRSIIPTCAISHDIIAGFPTETEADHHDTLSLMEEVVYSFGYMFKYSERPGTPAHKKLKDDIPDETKQRRLQEIIRLQSTHSLSRNLNLVETVHEVLIEGRSKRSENHWQGRTSEGNVVIFEKKPGTHIGDKLPIKITSASSATLLGITLEPLNTKVSTVVENLSIGTKYGA